MTYVLPVYPYRKPPELEKNTSFDYPVVVVGAGLAGLTAALELGSRGIRTVLLDEDHTVGAQGLSSRGICHAKRSLEIFDRSGVAGRIRAKGVTWNEGEVYRGTERLYRFNLQPEADQKFPAFVNLQQFYVEQYLVERLQQMPEVDLRWKNQVTKVENRESSIRVSVETPDGPYELQARYLLAADGAHSVVRAHPDLLDTYHDERHPAAREHVEHSTRAAIFIGPGSAGQRLIRDAILDLAQRHAWARAWVNTGRLSVASVYENSPFNRERGDFASDFAKPGTAAPDGRCGEGFFVERLGADFCVAYFGAAGPRLDVPTLTVAKSGHEPLFLRYGVKDTATYVFRPDGHVLARCTGIDGRFAQEAIQAVLDYKSNSTQRKHRMHPHTPGLTQAQIDRLYDELAALVDATAAPERERMLARLAVALAQRLGDYDQVRDAINSAAAT